MKNSEKAKILNDAMPYVKAFHGKCLVIKAGGEIVENEDSLLAFAEDLATLHSAGIHSIICHGGGPQVTKKMAEAGQTARYIRGQRVTDTATIELFVETIRNEVNAVLVQALESQGLSAKSFSEEREHLIRVEQKDPELGFVGAISSIEKGLLEQELQSGKVPVIACIGRDSCGQLFNVNADNVAAAVASSLSAAKLLLLTNVDGIYRDFEDKDSLISKLSLKEAEELLVSDVLSAGMIPKLESAMSALQQGVKQVHILNGRLPHSLLLEVFTKRGVGTMLYRSDDESD